MMTNRTPLYHLLSNAFRLDPASYQKCHSPAIHTQVKTGNHRMFDQFPSLLSDEDLNYYADRLKKIMLDIFAIQHDDRGTVLVNQKDKDALIYLLKDIAQQGSDNLLNVLGDIKQEIIHLLHWNEFKDQIKPQHVIAAYVATVTFEIYQKLSEFIKENQQKSSACMLFINQQYSRCAYSVLDNDKLKRVGIGVSFIGIGIGLLTAFTLFSKMNSTGSATVKPEELHGNWLNPS